MKMNKKLIEFLRIEELATIYCKIAEDRLKQGVLDF